MRRRGLAVAVGLAALVALAAAPAAHADGEAGLVVQDGDRVTTYCVAFTGDGISGDQLLKAAGLSFDAYGGGSGLAVCSLAGTGCESSGSFSSCFCQCQGAACTYWAFFTRSYGKSWVYSARAFNLLKAGDGDVHGWKWGTGGPNSAPAPQDVTFEQICGHSPRGGAAAPPLVTMTAAPPTAAAGGTSAPVATAAATVPSTAPGTQPASSPSSTVGTATALVTLPGATPADDGSPVPLPPARGDQGSAGDANDDTSASGGLVGFGVIAGVLIAGIVAALVWRTRHAG